jgi:hypothetical protein
MPDMTPTVHCKETMPKIRNKYSSEKELRGLSANFHIHVSVSDLYIYTIGLPILLKENMWTRPGNIQIAHRLMNVEIETEETVQFLFWDYINGIFIAVQPRSFARNLPHGVGDVTVLGYSQQLVWPKT